MFNNIFNLFIIKSNFIIIIIIIIIIVINILMKFWKPIGL